MEEKEERERSHDVNAEEKEHKWKKLTKTHKVCLICGLNRLVLMPIETIKKENDV